MKTTTEFLRRKSFEKRSSQTEKTNVVRVRSLVDIYEIPNTGWPSVQTENWCVRKYPCWKEKCKTDLFEKEFLDSMFRFGSNFSSLLSKLCFKADLRILGRLMYRVVMNFAYSSESFNFSKSYKILWQWILFGRNKIIIFQIDVDNRFYVILLLYVYYVPFRD